MSAEAYARISSFEAGNDRLELQADGEDMDALAAALALRDVKRILEVGCGSGALTRALARRLGGKPEIVGLDLSPAHVAFAQATAAHRGARRLRFVTGDGRDPPAEFTASFDVVLARYVFMYALADGSAVDLLAGMISCLRPGGRLLLIEADINFGATLFPPPDEPLARAMRAIVRHYRAYGGIEWRAGVRMGEFLRRAGLEGVDVRLIDGRIIHGGRPRALVEHDGRDLEALLAPAIGAPADSAAVRDLAGEWRRRLADPTGFSYTPVFVTSWTKPAGHARDRGRPRPC